ncbi:uncharacterized protein B0I36DRAFT_353548 [Microdochium trichocladiopsis]|uniref:Apple domain-containing protein n=1 Tax=Microdochium trichocladiopsis TaxID=1682393 RepID=A0A9P9BNE6_9PEZI|nr:uncharacterized protein B0I36DRAFT_353548 [Microdochium trichocladiopsis]KAH7020803.1 hypothetical protein B0I36DRAFT_353548 [Microdochium trichocladiopsis]
MQLTSFAITYILSVGALVSAAPLAGVDACAAVGDVVSLLTGPLKSRASSFCSDYLGGPKTTVLVQTATVTGATVTSLATLPNQTQTATASTTTITTITSTVTQREANPTTTVAVTATAAMRTVYQRGLTTVPVPIPTPLRIFAASKISSACSCIVALPTTTLRSTATQNVAGPVTTQTVQGRTVTVTYTFTVQETTSFITTQTVPATGTDTTTATVTTVTPILVKPKICNAKGLPNILSYTSNFNTNQAACIASCKNDSRCLSTGFYIVTDPFTGTSTGTCRSYDQPVADTADLGSGGTYTFNDKAC